MAERTCSKRGCKEKVHGQGLCAKHYRVAYKRGELQLLLFADDSRARHSLTSVNREQKTADCAICGPAGIRFRADGSAQCMTTQREADARHNVKKRQARRERRELRVPRQPSPQPEYSPEKGRRGRLKQKFGMTVDDYQQMLDEQGGACAICGRVSEARLAVDHDHGCCPGKKSCGKCIRGLLCRACNLALGYMQDDPAILGAAVEYLARGVSARAS